MGYVSPVKAVRRNLVSVLGLLALVATACEYDPALGTTPESSTCAGVAATLGFGYHEDLDPSGGSSHVGTEGDDVIVISSGPVTVDALGGDDLICVNDVLPTAAGAQIVIEGGAGTDTILGSSTTYETCSAERTSNCDAGDVVLAGDQLCDFDLLYPASWHFRLDEDLHCPDKGVQIINHSYPIPIDVTIDLNGYSLSAENDTSAVRIRDSGNEMTLTISNGTVSGINTIYAATEVTDVASGSILSSYGDLLVLDSTLGHLYWQSAGSARVERSTLNSADSRGTPLVVIDSDVVNDGGVALRGSIDMTGGSVSGASYGYRGVSNTFNVSASFTDVEVYDNDRGIWTESGPLGITMTDLVVRNNRIGIEVRGTDAVITNSVIENNTEQGISSRFTDSVTIHSSWIRNNGFGVDGTAEHDAIFVNFAETFTVIDSIISDNAGRAINFESGLHGPPPPVYTVTNSLIGNNGLPGCGDLPCYP